MKKSYFLHTAILVIALLWGATPGWAVPLTQSVTFNNFSQVKGGGYDTSRGDQIFIGSDGLEYTWFFEAATMKKSDSALQLQKNNGSFRSPSFETEYGFTVTITYTCSNDNASITETGTSNTVKGASPLSLTVSSLNAGVTIKAGSAVTSITKIEVTPLTNPSLQDAALTFTGITGDVTKELSEGSYSSVATTASDAPIVYSSSNQEVATIDNGTVTLHAKGTTVIKAEVAETETFNAASIQYTLTVIDPMTMTSFVKVTNGTVTDGKYIIVYQKRDDATSVVAMNNTNEGSYFECSNINLSEGKIITDNEAIIWDIAQNENGTYTISNNGLFVNYPSDGTKINLSETMTAGKSTWNITSKSSNTFQIANSGTSSRLLRYKNTNRFACYSNTGSEANPTLYRVDTGKSDATISFNDIEGTTCEKMLTDGSYNSEATTTSDAPIVYSSSNQEVATIDQKGVVTLHAGGTTVIKAEVAETDNYSAAVATYTLTVTDPALIKAFEKVTTGNITTGQYLIVYQANETATSGSVMNATVGDNKYLQARDIEITDNQISTDDTSIIWDITLNENGFYTISNNGQFVGYTGSDTNTKLYNSSDEGQSTWNIAKSSDNTVQISNSTTTDRVLRYNTSVPRFASYATTGSEKNPTLYRLSDGKTDVAVTFNEVSGDKTLFFEEGYTYNSAATAAPERQITYSSSNQEVATIDATGTVTLVGPGTAVIKATTEADDTYREGIAHYILTVKASSVTLPHEIDFKSGLGDWLSITTTGTAQWKSDSQYGATISGYINKKNTESEAYLISPVVTASNIILNFSSWFNYKGNALELLYSTDYDPNTMQPTEATWNNLSENATWPTETFKWVKSGDIELQDLTSPIRFAFRYTSTTDGASTWDITDLTIKEGIASGIATVEANGMKVINGKGEITIVTDAPASVAIYTLTGAQVRQIELVEGNNVVTLPAGIYVVNRQKVVVF